MKIFCYKCNSSEEMKQPSGCQKCGTRDIGIEPDLEMHKICRLFAIKQGYDRHAQTDFTLPQYFEKDPKLLSEWKTFKAKLLDFDAIPPPPDPPDREHLQRYYLFKSGALGLLAMNPGPPSPFSSIGWASIEQGVGQLLRECPLLKKLASDFTDKYWRKGS